MRATTSAAATSLSATTAEAATCWRAATLAAATSLKAATLAGAFSADHHGGYELEGHYFGGGYERPRAWGLLLRGSARGSARICRSARICAGSFAVACEDLRGSARETLAVDCEDLRGSARETWAVAVIKRHPRGSVSLTALLREDLRGCCG